MVSQLFLLRHGKTALAGKFAGSTDSELNSSGVEQVRRLRPLLAQEGFERIFCSPLRRCRQTADLLDLEGEITFLDDLREIDFGVWEGKTYSEIEKKYSECVRQWANDPEGFCFPHGECCSDFIKRIERFKTLLQGQHNQKVLIVSHGGVIRHLICLFLGLPFRNHLLFQVNEATFTTLDCFSEGGVLTGMNRGGGNNG